ncbi:MAG: hypothetical protein M3Y87_30780, partial [Myxococcota bacterium]|nr:hypothetical protein [Myxococcota bacterium]
PPPPPRSPAVGGVARMRDALFGGASAKKAKGGASSEGAMLERATDGGADRVFDLLMTQKADGRFERTPTLDAWLGAARRAPLDAAIATHGEALACTAVVIALLEAEAADRDSEWRPAVDKAKAWLAAKGASVDGASIVQVSRGAG